MKASAILLVCPLLVLGLFGWLTLSGGSTSPVPVGRPSAPAAAPVLEAPVASGYEALAFQDLFIRPVGPYGLEYTPAAKRLNGHRVRMTGHMVRHYHDDPRVFLFAATPMTHDQREYILADSLPVSLVHVFLEARPGQAPDWRPRAITVYGTLETGPQQEVDGRISHVRLQAEHVTEGDSSRLLELRRPIVLQRSRMKAAQPATAATAPPPSDNRQPHLRPRTAEIFPQVNPTQTPSSSS